MAEEKSAEAVQEAEAEAAVMEPVAGTSPEGGASPGGLDFVLDVPLQVTVEVGGARMHVREVLQLAKGSVIELDRGSGEPADVLVNGRLVAKGEITVVDDRMAVRIVEVLGTDRIGH